MRISTIEGNHLIGLNHEEALLMVRILAAASLHEPTAIELHHDGDALRFIQQLSGTLMHHLADPIQKKSFGKG
jgi:hypothetical protein